VSLFRSMQPVEVKVCDIALRHPPSGALCRRESLNFPHFFEQSEFEFPAVSGCAFAFLLVDLIVPRGLCVLFHYRIGSFLAFFAIATQGAWMLAEQGSYLIRGFCGFEEYSLACSARWCDDSLNGACKFWLRLNERLSVHPVGNTCWANGRMYCYITYSALHSFHTEHLEVHVIISLVVRDEVGTHDNRGSPRGSDDCVLVPVMPTSSRRYANWSLGIGSVRMSAAFSRVSQYCNAMLFVWTRSCRNLVAISRYLLLFPMVSFVAIC